MKRKNFENIGKVAVNEITLCDTEIGLYIPIEKMSENIRREYEKSEKQFTETVKKEHPEVDLSQYTLYRDVALHMNIHNGKVAYSVAIILWIQDEDENEIHVEFYDPFEIEINAEDNKYLKKLVMNKLMEAFF
ncbi:MAG: hypothetical protein ACOCNL_12915 [Acetivibrio ethanolgignens]